MYYIRLDLDTYYINLDLDTYYICLDLDTYYIHLDPKIWRTLSFNIYPHQCQHH